MAYTQKNNPFTTTSPLKDNGGLPKFSSTKEDAPGYVPPKDSGKIKTYNAGKPNIIGGSGSLGVIGAGGIKLGVKLLKKGFGKLWKTFTNAPKQYASTITKPATKTVTKTKPRGKTAYEKMSKGEKAAYNHPAAKTFRETGKTPTRVAIETGKDTTKKLQAYFAKKYDSPSGYYRSDAKGWPLPKK